ncbi:hypothetical protein [Variovorax paradoxus]|uniref:hypothetical protein n=1 Tax=Variovorax paradoxus TaxID=34073 RepID=UPI0011862A49|nr:hypothetical protein [Variovorax paradoxus]
MISSAREFMLLCASQRESDIAKSLQDEAPFKVWEDLILHYKSYQIDVAQNRTIPAEIMKALANQGDEIVRSILAEKRRLPTDLFHFFSRDSSPLIRKIIAANQKTPIDIVKYLTGDEDEDVASVARFRLGV